ncbi:MAG TPA: helix-turn-helix domain-containing protein [Candidatus Limnocylindrales bacterium]|nr:helix-turn-helix domain-containing protein [Candidatus Limnocylindrales bacterium]
MKHYGQYCPVARTSELLAERWTPIIIRNLLQGCTSFGELLEGAPGISRALLAQRLESLRAANVLTAERHPAGRGRTYRLTERGYELKGVIDAMGSWGARWLELTARDLGPGYLLWATCRLADVAQLPSTGLIVRIDLADRPDERYWLLLRRPQSELCSHQPGQPEDLVVQTDTETLARWHLRQVTYDAAVGSGRLRLDGPRVRVRAFLRCLRPSPFAQPARLPELASRVLPDVARQRAVRQARRAMSASSSGPKGRKVAAR